MAVDVIRCSAKDNVAVVVNPNGFRGVSFKHKIALSAIPKGGEIIRYGVPIGVASEDIHADDHVHKHNLSSHPTPPWERIHELPIGGYVPPRRPTLGDHTWSGYSNGAGKPAATRNVLGIMASVKCSGGAIKLALAKIRERMLPRYRNVDAVMGVEHDWGCGCAINTPGAAITQRIFNNILRHPNFGRIAVVRLGCEKNSVERIFGDEKPGKLSTSLPMVSPGPVEIGIQEEGSITKTADAICRWAEVALEAMNERKRVTLSVSALGAIAAQCGGSDAMSGITANPAVGAAMDHFAWLGAMPNFTETSEIVGALDSLLWRCSSERVGRKLIEGVQWYRNYLRRDGADFDGNPTPGNNEGGLTNIAEKSLGSVAKSGQTPIMDVVGPGELFRAPGLNFMNGPANDFIGMTTQAAGGSVIGMMTTGQGRGSDLPICPWIMIASNSPLARRMTDCIDIDAGTVATGEETIEQVGRRIFHRVLAVASGEKTIGEKYGYDNVFALFTPGVTT